MASLIQHGNIYNKGLIPGTADLRDLSQYKYAKQTVLLKHFSVTTRLTSFLTN